MLRATEYSEKGGQGMRMALRIEYGTVEEGVKKCLGCITAREGREDEGVCRQW